MNSQVVRALKERPLLGVLAVAIAVVFMIDLANLRPAADTSPSAAGGGPGVPTPGAPWTPGTPTTGTSLSPTPGAVPSAGGSTFLPGSPSPHSKPPVPRSAVPHFGLKTQGVTDREVKVGVSYNVASCGGAAALEAMVGPSIAGDMKKSIATYARYVNDTGGIGGRKYLPVIADDGGSGCPEKNIAAAVKMAEEDKVFMAIPGLHIESDYIMNKYKIPVFGGREDPKSLARYGPNGLQVLEPTEPTFEAWASFGRYYLKSKEHTPCLIRIESGAAGDFDTAEKILRAKMADYGLKFKEIYVFKDDPSTAQTQSNTIVASAKKALCDQAWFLAGNPIGLIFLTDAATQNQWFPTWTFTAMTVLTDDDTIASLMDPVQWNNAIGLSYRVPAGYHRMEGNCKAIYEKYNPNDGQSDSASAKIACATILTTAEMMRRAVALTGTLDADTLLLGADAVNNDFFYDATVPLDWQYPSVRGPFKTRAFSHYTVVHWSSTQKKYYFPEYPCYYKVFKANNGGCEDLSRTYHK
ncbi:MAG: ABC transporter substrate-binding protein [Acidobacteria bacterium]|nr:ABC transporter substrate-binding protein [Acidobacteriota bacterium]